MKNREIGLTNVNWNKVGSDKCLQYDRLYASSDMQHWLVKGQGVAQCYERPLWRSCGDVDLFFDAENYERAKGFLMPLATSVEPEDQRKKHLAMTIDSWLVELHGLMSTEISERINAGVERVQSNIFAGVAYGCGRMTGWMCRCLRRTMT